MFPPVPVIESARTRNNDDSSPANADERSVDERREPNSFMIIERVLV